MCGRYTIHADAEAIIRRFLLGRVPAAMRRRYNVAPTQTVPVVRLDESGQRLMEPMRWGLVPSWAADPAIGSRMINARCESLADKPAFRDSLKHRRCLVIADGFYEWRKDPGGKTPMYIRRGENQPFAFAGLWDRWMDKTSGEELRTCTIITTHANELVRSIHDRMPVILLPEHEDRWLRGDGSPAELLRPYPLDDLVTHPVSKRVNTAKDDSPACIERAEAEGMLF